MRLTVRISGLLAILARQPQDLGRGTLLVVGPSNGHHRPTAQAQLSREPKSDVMLGHWRHTWDIDQSFVDTAGL